MLEFATTYELTKQTVTSKLNSTGTSLEDQSDPALPAGTRFTVKIGANPHFYAIQLAREVHGSSMYVVSAPRLEKAARPVGVS